MPHQKGNTIKQRRAKARHVLIPIIRFSTKPLKSTDIKTHFAICKASTIGIMGLKNG